MSTARIEVCGPQLLAARFVDTVCDLAVRTDPGAPGWRPPAVDGRLRLASWLTVELRIRRDDSTDPTALGSIWLHAPGRPAPTAEETAGILAVAAAPGAPSGSWPAGVPMLGWDPVRPQSGRSVLSLALQRAAEVTRPPADAGPAVRPLPAPLPRRSGPAPAPAASGGAAGRS